MSKKMNEASSGDYAKLNRKEKKIYREAHSRLQKTIQEVIDGIYKDLDVLLEVNISTVIKFPEE